MSTLIELKDWLEKGGKIRHKAWRDNKYIWRDKKGEFLDGKGNIYPTFYPDDVFSDEWEKVEDDARWEPKNNDKYYYVGYDGSVKEDTWSFYSPLDVEVRNFYNCFKTREEALKARDLWVAERELRSLADGDKWVIMCDKDGEKFCSSRAASYIESPYRFSTPKKAEQAIKQLGSYKLKLIFGVGVKE